MEDVKRQSKEPTVFKRGVNVSGRKKKKFKNQESRVAKEVSGKVTPASGALWGSKGDVRNDLFLIECKTTKRTSIL